jgi:hypothetical protein
MRHLIIALGILVITAHANAQSSTKPAPPAAPAPAADATVPPLTKTVASDPNDSPMVRAAKKAVASRVNAGQRRVVTLNSTSSRGRFAESTGASEGPKVVPLSPAGWATPVQRPQPSASERQAIAQRDAQLKKVQKEQGAMAGEMDEPYGGDVEEDEAEQRLAKAMAEQQKLEQSAQKPPR